MKNIQKAVVVLIIAILLFSIFYYQFGIDHTAIQKSITVSPPTNRNSTGNTTTTHNKTNNTTVQKPQKIEVIGTGHHRIHIIILHLITVQ